MGEFSIGFIIFCAAAAFFLGRISAYCEHDYLYRKHGHCESDDAMHKEAAKNKAKAERILGES